MDEEVIYAWDVVGKQVVYRIPGKFYEVGMDDSDENPIWFIAGDDAVEDIDSLPRVDGESGEYR